MNDTGCALTMYVILDIDFSSEVVLDKHWSVLSLIHISAVPHGHMFAILLFRFDLCTTLLSVMRLPSLPNMPIPAQQSMRLYRSYARIEESERSTDRDGGFPKVKESRSSIVRAPPTKPHTMATHLASSFLRKRRCSRPCASLHLIAAITSQWRT